MQRFLRAIRHSVSSGALSFRNERVIRMWITTDQAIAFVSDLKKTGRYQADVY